MDEAEKRIFEKYKEDQDMDYAKMIDHMKQWMGMKMYQD